MFYTVLLQTRVSHISPMPSIALKPRGLRGLVVLNALHLKAPVAVRHKVKRARVLLAPLAPARRTVGAVADAAVAIHDLMTPEVPKSSG